MKIAGTATLEASPLQVWDAIHDPGVLARTLPGCERLVQTGPDAYDMTVTAGVAAIKGTYDGKVAMLDPQHPNQFRMTASGAGAPGTVDADVLVRLAPAENGGTTLTYEADASVGGVIGGVGQRMLQGVTKKMAGQFFKAVDADIVSGGAPVAVEAPVPAEVAVGAPVPGAPAPVPATTGAVYTSRPAAAATDGATRIRDFVLGTATGAGIALVGVLIGWAVGR